ncbi:membrane bound O-acyl transferase family-domain-containing protein [Phanerochaete sordida]|uniref:Membrane bound O-acyl transferase family-domain-containing protein n=1 Tax=Phanerochaete sordida TaxID=48140 RepID=A0A9P3GIB1_9APHY|nr:membrane bound O-acyl transferase family-domain-containing protein [Phanerochaete sordida]
MAGPLLLIYAAPLHLAISLILSMRHRPVFATRFSVFAALLAATVIYVSLNSGSTGELSSYVAAVEMGNACFLAALLLLLRDPVRDCRHEAQKEEAAQMPYWRRLWWALSLTYSHRGVGWNYQVAHLPLRPTHTRRNFIASRIARLALHGLLMDVVHSYMSLDPILSASRDTVAELRLQRPWLFVFDSGVWVLYFYTGYNIVYDALSLAAVASGCSEPNAWPVSFGRWTDAYTVRRFWGRVWHQMLRHSVSGLGKACARALRCAPGSWASSHVQLFAAFALSGAAHALGDCVLGIPGASIRFFVAQALAITLEDAVVAGGTRLGVVDTPAVRMCGFVWTAAWVSYSNAWLGLAGPQLEAGHAHGQVATVSFVRPVLRYAAAVTGVDILKLVEAFVKGP